MSYCRNWCFTVNNYTPADEAALKALPFKYIVYGRETGDLGTSHLQGYVQLKTKLRRTALVKFLACHWEVAKGHDDDNYRYSTKQGDYVEFGERTSTRGASSTVLDRIARNKRLKFDDLESLVDDGVISLTQVRLVTNARADLLENRTLRKPSATLDWRDGESPNRWYWGPTGSGKSKRARIESPQFYDKACNKWWDGYDGVSPVIIDDFDKGHAALCHHLKRWGDRYPFIGEVKGGTAYALRPPSVSVTSNYAPKDIWFLSEDLAPIERRFKIVYVSIPVDADYSL
jgi:hypothetical protein